MDAFRIISCPIEATPEQAAKIEATLRAFANACNYVTKRAKEQRVSAKPKLQKLCYYEVRGRFGLSANLAIAATNGKRRGDGFHCPNCGHSDHSDKNAAKAMAAVGAAMSLRERSITVCCAWHGRACEVEISRH